MKAETAALLKHLDLVAVQAAVRSIEGVPEFDIDGIVERILVAADVWLLKDLAEVRGGEMLIEQYGECSESRGILDLVLCNESNYRLVDWKTTGDCTRPHYRDELTGDIQTALYLAYAQEWLNGAASHQDPNHPPGVRGGAPLKGGVGGGAPASSKRHLTTPPVSLEYRVLDEKGNIRSYVVNYSDAQVWRGKLNLALVQDHYKSREKDPFWEQRMPRACFGSHPCPFFKDCSNFEMPTHPIEVHALYVPKSKSAIKSYLDCNERYRRERLCGDASPQSSEMLVGTAFHIGVAEVWKQAYELMRNELVVV